MSDTRFELATFRSGVGRAAVAPIASDILLWESAPPVAPIALGCLFLGADACRGDPNLSDHEHKRDIDDIGSNEDTVDYGEQPRHNFADQDCHRGE
ncbi:hypothetical protein HDU89_001812 [Geranomyces variabilis]|nr:hypothetical protein HDU89_001812 [Geranomyces variabilis]